MTNISLLPSVSVVGSRNLYADISKHVEEYCATMWQLQVPAVKMCPFRLNKCGMCGKYVSATCAWGEHRHDIHQEGTVGDKRVNLGWVGQSEGGVGEEEYKWEELEELGGIGRNWEEGKEIIFIQRKLFLPMSPESALFISLLTTLCTKLHITLCTTLHTTLCTTLRTTLCTTLHTTLCTTLHTTLCTALHTTL